MVVSYDVFTAQVPVALAGMTAPPDAVSSIRNTRSLIE